MAYIRAIKNGNYSAPSTWDGGVVPTTGDIACADTFRITIDTTSILATLSVAMADLVAAGGVAATTKTGGFILPDNSTTSIHSGIRFDHSMTVARGSISTTVPLHVRPGCTISLGPIVYVSGYAASGATQLWVVRLDLETSTINATFADFTIPAVGSSAGWAIVLNAAVNGGTFNGTFGNCKYINPWGNLNMMKFFALNGSNMRIAYNIIINGVIDGYSGDGISFYMNPLPTGLPNQNFTYNGTTIGENSGSASYCKALRIDNVHNVTFTSPLVIGSGFDVSDYEIEISGLRGTLLFQGEVTARYYSLSVTGTGDVTFDQAIYFNKNSISFNLSNTGVIRTKSIIGYGNTITTMDNHGGLYVSGNSEVIINGDLKYNSGTTMCSPMVSLMTASTRPVTITGNLDGRNAYVSSESIDSSSCLWITNTRTGPITINGNVYGSESGSTSSVNFSSGAIRYSNSTATYQNLTINGNVYGGTLSPAISGPSQANVVVDVNGEVHGGGLYGANTYGPPGIVLYNGYASVKALVHHSSGTVPVWGRVKFRNTLQAYVKGRDTSSLEFLLNTQINVIPTASDVRFGVSTGVTTGTLVVPQASTVLDGVVFDNGTTGTLSIGGGGTSGSCDLTNVEAGITAIKAKTDQITFTASGVVADAGTTGGSGTVDLSPITSAISTVDGKVTSIKTKTDKLSFSSGKVIADASVIDYTSQLSAITSTVNAISDAVDLIDAVTSKIAFETVYSEGDPNLAQVIFKAEFNGTNGSTTINADTGQIGTNQGSPSLNTVYTRTGTSSVALSGSIVSYGDISSLNLGANDFTIEFSVNFSSIVSTVGDYAGVVGKRAGNGDFSWICYVTEGKMNFLTSGTSAVSIVHPTTLSAGAWYDVAISRTGDILKFYVNGVLSQISCTGLNIATTTAPFFIGRLSYDISSYHMFGYLDRLRITIGTGRYNSVAPVSPPVSEYPTTLNGIAQSYKVVANCDSGTTIPTDLTDRLTDLRNRINAIHFIVKDE